MSAFEYSVAIDHEPAISRCARLVRPSALSRTFGNHCVSESPRQPLRSSALVPAATPPRKPRRVPLPSDMRRLLRVDGVPAGDHRAHIVPGAGQNDHDDVHDEETEEGESQDEMDGARALAAAEDPDEPRERAVD